MVYLTNSIQTTKMKIKYVQTMIQKLSHAVSIEMISFRILDLFYHYILCLRKPDVGKEIVPCQKNSMDLKQIINKNILFLQTITNLMIIH